MERRFRDFVNLVVLVTLIGGILLFVGCSKKEPEKYKIGADLFLTGNQAVLGEFAKNALMLAEEEINVRGGINGREIQIVYADSKDTPKDAIAAFNRLLSVEKVPVIISTGDAVSISLIPIADEKKVVLFATIAATPGITEKSEWFFRGFITADAQAETMSNFAFHKLNLRKIAVLYINNEFGLASLKAFRESFEEYGGQIVGTESYEINDTNLRPQLIKLKPLNPEGIWVTGFGPAYGVAIKQIREMEINTTILADNSLSVPYTRQQIGEGVEGAFFSSTLFDAESPASEKAAQFVEKYTKKYGSPPSFMSAFAYDDLMVIAKAIELKGYSSPAIREGLLSVQDYQGVMGRLSFSPTGEMNFRIIVKKVEQGKAVDVSK